MRGRVLVVDARGRVLADSAHAAPLGTSYADRPEIARRTARRPVPARAPQQQPGRRPARHRRADRPRRPGRRARFASRRASRRCTAPSGGRSSRWCSSARPCCSSDWPPVRSSPARSRGRCGGSSGPPAAWPTATSRRVPQRKGSTEQRSLARSFNEMTAAPDRARSPPAAVRGRRVAPAAHAAHRPAAPSRGARAAEPRPTDLREAVARRSTASRGSSTSCSCSAAPARRSAAVTRCDLAAAARAAAQRFSEAAAGRGMAIARHRTGHPGLRLVRTARTRPRPRRARGERDRLRGRRRRDRDRRRARPGARCVDRGPGVRAGEEELLFERFHRGMPRASGAAPGTGLGLAIARALARGWGGDVTVRAREGGGTRALVTMPSRPRGTTVRGRTSRAGGHPGRPMAPRRLGRCSPFSVSPWRSASRSSRASSRPADRPVLRVAHRR